MIPLFSEQPADPAEARRRQLYEAGLHLEELIVGGVVAPTWLDGGRAFLFTAIEDGVREIRRVDCATGAQRPLFDAARLIPALEQARGTKLTGAGLPFEFAIPLGADLFQVTFEGRDYEIDARTCAVRAARGEGPLEAIAPNSETNRRRPRTFDKPINLIGSMSVADSPSPDGRWFAALRDKNVWLRSTADNRERQLTRDGGGEIDWDIESQRQLIGPDMSITVPQRSGWSPNAARLFAVRSDRSQVFKMPSVHFLKRFEEATFTNFPKAGAKIERTQAFAIDILAERLVPLAIDRSDEHYLLFCDWLPNSRELLFMRIDRPFRTLEIFRADAETGETRAIVTETSETFVRLQHEYIYAGVTGLTILPDGDGFLLLSERDGWKHIYRYDLDGHLIVQLTSGDYVVAGVVHVDQAADRLLFWAHHDRDRPYDLHICSVPLSGGAVTRLTDRPGQHRALIAPDGSSFLDIHSSVDRAPRTDLRRIDGSFVATITRADTRRAEALAMPDPEEFCVKAADGETDLWGVLHKPFDFDPALSYPVVEYIYGGPNVSLPRRNGEVPYGTFANQLRAMAHLGYITVVLDARGTPNRSKAFHDVVHGKWGRHEIPDHATALRQLGASRPWMDLSRVGVYGHSWGGHFATRALIDAPDLYSVAVASAPGYDPYDGNIYEPYIGQPQDARDAYEFANPIRSAARIGGKLMMIGGTSDHSTFTSVIKMADALVQNGIDHDLVLLPGEGHGYLGAANDYALRRINAHFRRHLGTPRKPTA